MIIKKFIECGKQTKQMLKEFEQAQKKDSSEYAALSRKMAVLSEIQGYIIPRRLDARVIPREVHCPCQEQMGLQADRRALSNHPREP